MKQQTTKHDGVVSEALPNTMFRIALDGEEQIVILATLKGSLRRRYVRIFPGDKVQIEMTKYDTERGRIIRKYGKKR